MSEVLPLSVMTQHSQYDYTNLTVVHSLCRPMRASQIVSRVLVLSKMLHTLFIKYTLVQLKPVFFENIFNSHLTEIEINFHILQLKHK